MRTLVFFAGLISSTAFAVSFDSAAYCEKVSASAGGSYMIEKGCRMNEGNSRAQLEASDAPPRVLAFCERVANSAGGSYQIMWGCVMNEMNAKASMGK